MISIFLIIGAIEVTIANMAKAERSKTDQVYVRVVHVPWIHSCIPLSVTLKTSSIMV